MIIVDVETTGLEPLKHSIASIGALDFHNPKNQFYEECRIWKGAEIQQEALNINGFTREQLTDPIKISLEEAILNFTDWLESVGDRTLAGENPSFDRDFLKDSYERCCLEYHLGFRTIDLHSLCYTHYVKRGITPPNQKRRTDINTDKTLNYVGLPSEPRPHNALTGAKMEAEAFSRLINRKFLLEEFKHFEIPDYL